MAPLTWGFDRWSLDSDPTKEWRVQSLMQMTFHNCIMAPRFKALSGEEVEGFPDREASVGHTRTFMLLPGLVRGVRIQSQGCWGRTEEWA